ncbi:MAG: site-specific DNA-methyltransferase [Verrucomicrobiota bacterium]
MPTLEFKGKSFVYTHHLAVPFRELVIDPKKSLPASGAKPSLEDNLIIHGDNLHALKALLPIYAGKVDCIFIDAPYNTGNEGWCYNDNVRSPLMRDWLKKASPVDKEDLERHDKWLAMMWPRLKLLHELLAEDGTIFATIDDNEQHRLRMILDEVFGEDRFVASVAWQKAYSPRMDAQGFSKDCDSILIYGKSPDAYIAKTIVNQATGAEQTVRLRSWRKEGSGSLRADRPNLWYALTAPDGSKLWPVKPDGTEGRWRGNLEYFKKLESEGSVEWMKRDNQWHTYIKQVVDSSKPRPPSTWWDSEFAGHNHEAAETLKAILGVGIFQTPKPVTLLSRVLELATDKDSIVLDSFAGSGTTAHAVLAQNKKDDGNRKFILVECEDYADKLTAERVRRVIRGYKFEGTQREELMREPLTWTKLKNAGELLEKADSFDLLDGKRFDRISKLVEDGALVVTGEKKVTEKVEGLGGSFTFCTLGEEMGLDKLLAGDKLPSLDALAKYVFYTATGRTLQDVPKQKADSDGYIGETDLYRVHLLYRPEKAWLRSNDASLTEKLVARMVAGNKGKKLVLVFAAAKFMGQRELTRQGVEFCQLPYTIHRIMGD